MISTREGALAPAATKGRLAGGGHSMEGFVVIAPRSCVGLGWVGVEGGFWAGAVPA
jgi:hypothetical protein